MYKLGIISPTYNEVANIPILVERVQLVVDENKIKTLLLIVDDGSPDGTGEAVNKAIADLESQYLTVELLQRGSKKGFSTAYIEGISQVRDQVEFVMSMDADLSHQQKYIPDFLNKAESEGLDLVIGSRYTKGGGVENWGWHRILLSRWASIYCWLILWIPLTDFSGGFNLFRSSYIKDFNFGSIVAKGYFFLIEIKYKLIKSGAKFGEVPIVFVDRINGDSKMTLDKMIENAVGVIKLKFSNLNNK
jgi:dolichol-phosphate mannosyltransferase